MASLFPIENFIQLPNGVVRALYREGGVEGTTAFTEVERSE